MKKEKEPSLSHRKRLGRREKTDSEKHTHAAKTYMFSFPTYLNIMSCVMFVSYFRKKENVYVIM